MAMTVRKVLAATQAWGRGIDNYRMPAQYGVFDAAGRKVGIILGARVSYMQRGSWELCWLSPEGTPRLLRSFTSFKSAKAFAETWDGSAPERFNADGSFKYAEVKS